MMDRRATVSRHDPILTAMRLDSPLALGNGRFAFSVDATGLQTYADSYEHNMPLATMSDWSWHSFPNPHGWSIEGFEFTEYESHGRRVPYADVQGKQRTPEIDWLRANPHRFNLGRVGFRLRRADGQLAAPHLVRSIEQRLDLWQGVLTSTFELEGVPVEVQTICHPTRDVIGVRVSSELITAGRLDIQLYFPYAGIDHSGAEWNSVDAHSSLVTSSGESSANVHRVLDGTEYDVAVAWSGRGEFIEADVHRFLIRPHSATPLVAATIGFNSGRAPLPDFDETMRACTEHWEHFWSTGAAIDLSRSTDSRWFELERRIVLSQFMTATQGAGSHPPAEGALTNSNWHGKFHLEMHPWNSAHFVPWGRVELLENSMDFYREILPRARDTARRQGYAGARWPKMTTPEGAESPSDISPFLIWQQPHPIFFAELLRGVIGDEVVPAFAEIVEATAAFMADYAARDGDRLVLGPPLQGAQEIFPRDTTMNPTFELGYWRWGLETAQYWRQLQGLAAEPAWDVVLRDLSALPQADGKYLFAETNPDSYRLARAPESETGLLGHTDYGFGGDNQCHPSVVGAYSMIASSAVDPETMRRTLKWIMANWTWASAWGWDPALLALCATRLGEPDIAIEALLKDMPRNTYLPNGHNPQIPARFIASISGNGSLLYAIAMMVAGTRDDPAAGGFPAGWVVEHEGFLPVV